MARLARGWGRFFALCALASAAGAQVASRPAAQIQQRSTAAVRAQTAASVGAACRLMGAPMYNLDPNVGLEEITPSVLIDFDAPAGGWNNFRPLGSPPVIDFAWGPDFNLYGITNALAPSNANSLFRYDPSSGAATLIGAVGLQLQDGDLATDPKTGTIYGVDGNQLFRLSGLTPNATASAAEPLGPVILPATVTGAEIIGLAFDSSGALFAIAQLPGVTSQAAHLLRLPVPANASVPINAQDVRTLSRRFGTPGVATVGGMEFSNGQLFFVEGNRPLASQGNVNGENIYEINVTSGLTTSLDGAAMPYGLGSLVNCRSQIQICRPPPPDMVAWYAMDGNPNDRILGNNAVPSATASFAGAKVGQGAFLYTGYLTIPPGPVLNQGLGDFSIEAWIVILPETLNAGVRTLLDKRAYVNGGLRGWSLMEYNGRLGLQLADGDYTNYYDGTPLSVGYHHIAVTIDRDNPQGIVFYVDGVPRPGLNPTGRQGNLDNNAPTHIGRHSFQTASERWVRIDELQFFDRVLASQEVFSTWEAQANGNCK